MRFGALTCIEIASLGASKIRDSLFVLKPIVLEQVADSFEGANSMWLLPLVVSIPHLHLLRDVIKRGRVDVATWVSSLS